jgi:hypothetical protein
MTDTIERRARVLSALFTQIVLGVGAAGCSPPPPTEVPDAPPPEPQPPAPVESSTPSSSAAVTPPPRSHVEERPPVKEVGGACDLGAPQSRVGEGMANLVHGLNPKVPFDYIELDLLGLGESGNVMMASGKKCATAKDWRTCEAQVARAALGEGERGFRPGCIPGHCSHALVVTRGDDVSIIPTIEGIKELLGTIDTPAEALLLAYAGDYSPRGSHYPKCEMLSGKGMTKKSDGSFELVTEKTINWCPITTATQPLRITTRGDLIEGARLGVSSGGACAGRRPAGFRAARSARRPADPVGAYLSDLARLEAASIRAFEDLARELAEHRAPRQLVDAAMQARGDEIEHARDAYRHARRYGAAAGAARAGKARARGTRRSLAALAGENEVEGCVREAFGALAATWQAEHAHDPELAAMFRTIAEDETRHLALALELRDFYRTRLAPEEVRSVARRRQRALTELATELRGVVDPRVSELAGVPPPDVASALVERLSSVI